MQVNEFAGRIYHAKDHLCTWEGHVQASFAELLRHASGEYIRTRCKVLDRQKVRQDDLVYYK